MNKWVNSSIAGLFRALFFGLLMGLSALGIAQESGSAGNETTTVEFEQVNINQADAATIARVLDGIGETRAKAIVTWREEFGDFTSMEDLLMVNGVGAVTVRNNESRIRFE